MKRTIATALIAATCVAGGYVGRDYSNVGPLIDPPRPAAVIVRGPGEGFVGRDYFFALEASGSHGPPTWIVTPEADVAPSEDRRTMRMRCDAPGLYTVTVTLADRSANVATDVTFFEAIDLEAEINQATAMAQAATASEPEPPKLSQIIQSLPHFPQDDATREMALNVFQVLTSQVSNGELPRGTNPLAIARARSGEALSEFLADLEGAADELRAGGGLSDTASYAPFVAAIVEALE